MLCLPGPPENHLPWGAVQPYLVEPLLPNASEAIIFSVFLRVIVLVVSLQIVSTSLAVKSASNRASNNKLPSSKLSFCPLILHPHNPALCMLFQFLPYIIDWLCSSYALYTLLSWFCADIILLIGPQACMTGRDGSTPRRGVVNIISEHKFLYHLQAMAG